MYYYDLTGNNVQTFTKKDGLNEANISALKYDSLTRTLLVAYSSGAIDVITDNGITYFTDISRSDFLGSKNITDINIYNGYAYISTGIGLIVFDLAKKEIKESYSNLNSTGALTAISASVVFHDTLFAISSNGLISAPLTSSINRMDFTNWKSYLNSDSISPTISQLSCNDTWLFAGANKDYIYKYTNGKWGRLLSTKNSPDILRDMVSINGRTIVAFGWLSIFINDSLKLDTLYKGEWSNLSNVIFKPHNTNILYASDYGNGLVQMAYNNASTFVPSSPAAKDAFCIKYINGKMYLLAGGYYNNMQSTGRREPVCIFDNFNWATLNLNVTDILTTVYNPVNGYQYFTMIKSQYIKAGFVILKPDNSLLYIGDSTQTPGSTFIDPVGPGAGYLEIMDMAVDPSGVSWIIQSSESHLKPILHSYDLNGKFKSYDINTTDAQSWPSNIIIDDFGNKWIRLGARDNNGLFVFNENRAANQQVISLSNSVGSGNLPSINVTCLAKSTNGEIWVGTDNGVGVFYNPANIFSSQGSDAGRPVYNSYPLLVGQTVNYIKVDGGNNKWIATNNGVWQFSPDGSSVINYFTAENSPLPSDQVLNMDINDKTGEVFFITNGGVASYRALATAPDQAYNTVQVFPNPVLPNFSGTVGIRGLTSQSFVKITDINGRLVYQTVSQGGTATWNMITTSGEQAKPGVYLVFSVSQDGTEQIVSKFAVLD
jgi:hypothetical protein